MTYGIADVMNLLRLAGESGDEVRQRIERRKIEALLGYCETAACRRQVLLGYFGESGHKACGNCDNCHTPPANWDGTVAAQKALSAVYRTGQRFGARHLIDILLGHETERVRQLGHDRLKTFGVGTELDSRVWRSVYRQLVAQGLLTPDFLYGGLSLAPAAVDVLRGQGGVRFRFDKKEEPRARRDKGGTAAGALDAAASSLWEALRRWRLAEARRQEVPPYVIFHDATLMEVARRRPRSLSALAQIPGFGRSKLDRYGAMLVGVVETFHHESACSKKS
jgi:ATP-dependent DNA helicase RecQ